MSFDDDKVVSLDERRRAKKAAEKVIQKQQKRLKRGPRKTLPKLNLGYVLLAALIIAALGINYLKMQPQSGSFTLHVVGDTAYGNGSTDGNSLRYAIEVLEDNPQVKRLVLQNMPGTTDSQTNLRLADLFRNKSIATHLEATSVIASGAVDLFIGGETRTLECGAKIGVHSWRTAPGKSPETLGKDPFAAAHESFLRKMGIDPAFYAFTRDAAPPNEIHYMTMEEINRFELLTAPKNCP